MRILHTGFVRMLAVALLAGWLLAPAMAADGKKKEKTKATVAMRQHVYEALQKAQAMLEAKDYAGALAAVEKIRAGKKGKSLSPYERAQTWNLQAYLYYLQEKYPQAIDAYEKVLKQPEIPEALQQSTLKTIAQLYFITGDYKKALKSVQRLMASLEKPAADVYMLLGQAYFQLDQFDKALAPINKAVEMTRALGKKPRENWLLLLQVIYQKKNDYRSMLKVLQELMALYPKDTYLRTMAGVYSELGESMKQLGIMEALYEKGLLTSKTQITNLASLYMLHGVPYKAAVLLEREINQKKHVEANVRNLKMLSQAWYLAREDEKAIPPLKKAAKMAQEGELYLRLGQAYMNLDRDKEASEAIQQALNLGKLKRTDTAYIMLGMTLFNQNRLHEARKAFAKAAEDKRSRKVAKQWMAYVDSELKRIASMQ